MSFIKSVKHLFIEEVPQEPEEEQNTETSTTITPTEEESAETTVNYAEETSNEPQVDMAGIVDAKIFDSLMEALASNNREEFDYMDFKDALLAIEELPVDEKNKYLTIFKTNSKRSGLTFQGLVESTQYYKGVLKIEKEKFEEALQGQTSTHVESKQQALEEIKSLIHAKTEEIKRLTEEIALAQQESIEIKQYLTEAQGKIEITKKNFEETYASIVRQIDQDINKMTQYLQSPSDTTDEQTNQVDDTNDA